MKRFLSVILSIALLFAVVTVSATTAPEKTGLSFSGDWFYRTDKIMEKNIMTFEATVKLPEGYTAAGGTIYGCQRYSGLDRFEYKIAANGVPQIYIVKNKIVYDLNFSKANIPMGEWVHLAFARDTEENVMKCYVNGKYMQSISLSGKPESVAAPYVIGGDYTWENTAYFKGEINSIKIYSDIRTAREIKSDINSVDYDDLEAYYDLSDVTIGTGSKIEDISGNGYDARYEDIWLDEMPEVGEFDYSMIAIGDQQKMTAKAPQDVIAMHQYIADFAANGDNKLKYVFNLGDLTDFDTDEEYAVYEECLNILNEAGIDHSFVLGNHETKDAFNNNITYDEYGEAIGVDGTYDGTLLNYYKLVEIGDIKYLVLALEYCPDDDILAWADEVVSSYPEYNVIMITHFYLTSANYDEPVVSNEVAADISNNGQAMWDKFLSKHENVSLILGGHVGVTLIQELNQIGDNGNKVTSFLINPQDFDYYLLYDNASEHGTGMIAQMFFSNDGKNVEIRQYSTVRNKWFRSEAAFSFELDVVGDNNLSGADFD